MSATPRSVPEALTNLRPTTTIAADLLAAFALAVVCLFSAPTHAQASLPLGTVALSNVLWSCGQTGGWYYYQNGGNPTYMNCQSGVVVCPNTQSMQFTFGVLDPATVGISPTLGTIVILGGDGGTSPGDSGYADYYFRAGYEIVEMV